ncbi:MAG: hypothetical protein V3T31_00905 [candidate division Zixibacteria bacterium]
MAVTEYTYTKAVNLTVLADEIAADVGIIIALDHISTEDTALSVWMADVLPGPEETALDAVVSAHGNPAQPQADVVHTGIGAPDDYLGNDGDVCLDPDTLEIYKKVAGSWGTSKSIDGTPVFGVLSDVVFTTPATGELLKFDGTDWINNTLAEAGIAATSHTHVEADITDLQAYLLNITGENLESLADVTLTAIATGELLKWDGVKWINNTLAQAGIAAASHTHVEADITDLQAYLLDITGENLGSMADVTLTAIATGELLKWNGSAWINNTLAEAGIAAASHTHVEADITDLQAYLLNITAENFTDLSDVDTTGVAMGNRLEWDGSNWTAVAAGGGSVEIDNQYVGIDSNANTTSSSFVDVPTLTLTTSNTITLKYLVIATLSFNNTSKTDSCIFQLVADGVKIPHTEQTVLVGEVGDTDSVTIMGHVSLANAKVVKVQYRRTGGTLTVSERNLVIRGIG